MSDAPRPYCFVVMPFGRKPIPTEPGREYDFDKVYRVIIKRAIDLAGLKPIRADEHAGSHLIHAEMFRDLRDQPVVLADLSLGNPNVFYELGIRHTMSSRGTVLICREGFLPPFDVGLSRVIFYPYDGLSLDWESVSGVVDKVVDALEEAKRGQPDSPVHAFLDSVLAPEGGVGGAAANGRTRHSWQNEAELQQYHRTVAEHWNQEGRSGAAVVDEHGYSRFGIRAAAWFLCDLGRPVELDALSRAGFRAFDLCQFDAAQKLFKRLAKERPLTPTERLRLASNEAERDPTPTTAENAAKQMLEVARELEEGTATCVDPEERKVELANARSEIAGLLRWRWNVSGEADHLDEAIQAGEVAVRAIDALRPGLPPRLARREVLHHLTLLLLRRARDGSRDRRDLERHLDKLAACDAAALEGRDRIYVLGYQAIAEADRGNETRALLHAASLLLAVGAGPRERSNHSRDALPIVHLRRFIDGNVRWLRHPETVGRIGQLLDTEAPV